MPQGWLWIFFHLYAILQPFFFGLLSDEGDVNMSKQIDS